MPIKCWPPILKHNITTILHIQRKKEKERKKTKEEDRPSKTCADDRRC